MLATGSIPTLPPIRGIVRIDGRLDERVHAFRSLDDCLRLDAAVSTGSTTGARAAPSSWAAACSGSRSRGRSASAGSRPRSSRAATTCCAARSTTRPARSWPATSHRLGTTVYTGARATRLTEAGLVLDNGFVLETDLVVLTAGGRPSTALARRAGLEVRRGIVVDDTLRTSDPRIHAIGDCAQHGGRVTGFVPPAWEQAGVLARILDGEPATYDGSRTVARLRATGLDVAVLGDPLHAEGEVVEVSNPVVGSHRRLVVRDGVVVAATLVGDLSRIGLITQHFDRRTVLGPHEPGALLMPDRPPAPHVAARRRRGLRVRRRQRRRDPGLRLPGRGPRPHPRHHRLRRLRRHRPPAPRPAHRPHPGRNPHMSPQYRRRLVVVGHGMVGHRFVQAAIERGLTETHDIVVVGEEPRPAYDRVALTSFFEVGAEALSLLPEGEYDDPRVELVLGTAGRGVRPRDADGAARRRPGR